MSELAPPALPPERPDDPPVHYLEGQEQGFEVTTYPEPCVIVASGGMCEGGRIVQHLRQHIDDPHVNSLTIRRPFAGAA